MINPALIGSQSSLNAGDHEELKILLKNCLIPSRFNQELRKGEKYIDFNKRNFASNVSCPFRDVICTVRSCEAVGIVAHDAVHVLLKREPSDKIEGL